MSSVFKEWIKSHETNDYQIVENNQDCIELNTDYGKAEIHFTDVTEGTIVEFNIVSYKDQEVKFYLHFELNDEDHAHQLYDEMVETLIELKNKKTYSHGYTIRKKERFSKEAYSLCSGWRVVRYLVGMDYLW